MKRWMLLAIVMMAGLLGMAACQGATPVAEGGAAIPQAGAATPGEALPTPRAGLEASDPDTVVLASGRPQLVEFFAFW